MNFDERDLLTFAEQAGFAEVHLELQATLKQPRPRDAAEAEAGAMSARDTPLKWSGNPLNPTLEEASAQAPSLQEAEQLTAQLRPLVARMHGRERQALAYLWAIKQ